MASVAKPANRRADARANKARILDAAIDCLGRDPGASVSEIARAAGVGRVTLYGHFSSREEMIDAAFARVIAEGDRVLEAVDLSADPPDALRALIESSWLLVARSLTVLDAAEAALPPGRVQELHARPAERVEELVRRGQADGSFRTDLPAGWLVSVLHHVMHGAAGDINAGRLDADDAAAYISATVLPAFASGA